MHVIGCLSSPAQVACVCCGEEPQRRRHSPESNRQGRVNFKYLVLSSSQLHGITVIDIAYFVNGFHAGGKEQSRLSIRT